MKTLKVTLTGTAPLIMHSDRAAIPGSDENRYLKELSGKRKKTEEDHVELAYREFFVGLYINDELGPYLPADNLLKALVEAGQKFKQGKIVKSAVIVDHDMSLKYDGPRDAESLWEKKFYLQKTVVVQRNRVARTRPMFTDWSVDADITFDEDMIDLADVKKLLSVAGSYIGLCDFRPKYGRFTVR